MFTIAICTLCPMILVHGAARMVRTMENDASKFTLR